MFPNEQTSYAPLDESQSDHRQKINRLGLSGRFSPQSLLIAVAGAWDDLWQDLRRTRWLRGFGWFCLMAYFILLILTICSLPVLVEYDGEDRLRSEGANTCRPDSVFSITKSYSVWTASNPFEITYGFGKFGFGTAKLIDVIWDVVSCILLLTSSYS